MSSRWRRVHWEFWIPAFAGTVFVFWWLVVPSWQNISGQWRSASWPSTSGRVVVSKTVTSHSQQRTTKVYLFQYRFEVEGQQYDGKRYSFRFASGDRSSGVKRFDSGDQVTVYYDPANPNQCVIDPNSSAWWNYLVLSAMVLIPFAFILRLRSMSITRNSQADPPL